MTLPTPHRAVLLDDDQLPTSRADLNPGDIVVRRRADSLELGLVGGGEVRWIGDPIPRSSLPERAWAGDEAALLTAVEGVFAALRNRGG